MKKSLFLFIFLATLSSCSTLKQKDECEKIFDQELYYSKYAKISNYRKDQEILKKCGKLDSLDMKLFNLRFISGILLSEQPPDHKFTYRVVLKRINDIKNTEEYKNIKEKARLFAKIKDKIIDKSNWEKDKLIFLKMGVNEKQLKGFEKFILKSQISGMTYNEAFYLYEQELKAQKKKKSSYQFQTFSDYDQILQEANTQNKYILLYFSGYACQNCRLIEDNILKDDEIKSILNKNFVAYKLMVDSREKLKEPYVSKKTGQKLYTVGAKAASLEIERFNANMQPFFVIIDKNDHTVKTQTYTQSIPEFIKFLSVK